MDAKEKALQERKEHAFDAYCKKVLRHTGRDHLRRLERQRKHEMLFSEMPVAAYVAIPAPEDCFMQEHLFHVMGACVSVDNEDLAEAIGQLSPLRREIVLLSYFFRFSDREVAEALGMKRTTVQYQRKLALKELRRRIESMQ